MAVNSFHRKNVQGSFVSAPLFESIEWCLWQNKPTKPKRFSASNHFVRTRARFTHKQSFRYPRLGTFVRIHWVARLRLNDCLIKTKKRSAGSPVRSAYLFDSIEWLTHARPFFFVLWLLLVLADGFSSVLWRNTKKKIFLFFSLSKIRAKKPCKNESKINLKDTVSAKRFYE